MKRKEKYKKIRWKWMVPFYIMMIPGLVYFLINNYMPMAGIVMAFKKIDYSKGIFGSDWNGLANFEFLFASGQFGTMVRNTILYNGVFIIFNTVLGITVAILLNEIRAKIANRIYQTVILLPYLMSWVVVSYLAFAFLSNETGFINNGILEKLGLTQINFYQEPKYWPWILLFVNEWKNIGFSMIIYLAAIVGISKDYYEAASVDGATRWQQITRITLPCLKPTIITMFILSVSKMFYSDFGLFFQVPKNSGILYPTTMTIDTYVYNALMKQNNPGMSAAAGFLQAIVGFVLVIGANALIRKISREDAIF
ncbi:sugar ABC transporter permease [Lachnoclostridium sp. An169]|uniref:ABC transporter permease n=1 Tax=Lachnoclostridium sp. An169 TaxID=1965569 RepID=UPI000B3A779D|nr:ABC transporter permease subunit [Lachnoclostridium sp. An169]OUP82936.1 sugar ABC transporter permease [Lachnoclostridium sp. An169]HJA65524.1 ABC transporter permease subunit [Candidatus Mediterraneibacter cottocaccae]